MPRVIAFYLPQFYPTPENDIWWGKGFTEWTNVGRAKALFPKHYQPRVPADLGYYDLRIQDIRIQQAEMAKAAGIEGFCYWHYWFAGQRLLDMVFDEVVTSGTPDYPFCLCWANHSWKAKTWDPSIPDKMLMEQTYPGLEDYRRQFYQMLPAFKDRRYIKVEGKLLYGIFDPNAIPDINLFTSSWNSLAKENGLDGFFFFAFAQGSFNFPRVQGAFDVTVFDPLMDAYYKNISKPFNKIVFRLHSVLHKPVIMTYDYYTNMALSLFNKYPDTVPCAVPNFDHSPRSGTRAVILHASTPEKWKDYFSKVKQLAECKNDGLIFIKAWNEWGEGNYLEPDLRYGDAYLRALSDVIQP